jgi:alpha-mannosidase
MKNLHKTLTILGLILFWIPSQSQNKNFEKLYQLAAGSGNWVEGFQKNVGGNAFSYSSFRNDVTESMITRCTDGKMSMIWETPILLAKIDQDQLCFLWIASLDLTEMKHTFNVSFNGQKRFEITSSPNRDWSITNPEGGKLSFLTVETDLNGDASGYMYLQAPKSWLREGTAQNISITGQADGDNCWVIVYQATDALSYLQKSIEFDVWMKMELEETNKTVNCKIQGPFTLAGKELSLSANGKNQKILMARVGDKAEARFSLPLSAKNKSLIVNDPKGEVFFVQSLGTDFKTTRLLNKAILFNESKRSGNSVSIDAQRRYNPKTTADLLNLSKSVLGKGQIYLMNSSHQDIAWMDSPEKCVIERDTMLLAPLFRKAEKDKNYRFDVEDALMLKEFTERHPDKKALVKEMLADGRISCGSTFIQPYEEMYSGEALARQFYLGAKWLKDEFDYTATVYWNVDVPGRTLQMAQLMKKAGTRYLMISRHQRGIFNWYSPDGSFVTAYSPGHYGDSFIPLQKNFHEVAQYLATSSMEWEKYYAPKTQSPIIPVLSDSDMSPAKDYSELINSWTNITGLQNDKGTCDPVSLPRFKLSLAPDFFDAVIAQKPQLTSIQGERPAVWLYIHGPSHYEALKASREADVLLPVAEKLATINALTDGSFRNYPTAQLNRAWEAKIYPDHGWGGKHGDITDALFLSKYQFAKAEAEKIVDINLKELSSKVKTNTSLGIPLVVFNSTNQQRNDWCSTELTFGKAEAFNLEVADSKGIILKSQFSNATYFDDGSIKSATLQIMATNIPSIGYNTLYIRPLKTKPANAHPVFQNTVENSFYKITFANGGLSSIFDKELNQELVDPSKFKAGEVFTMRSVGNGAGEFSDVQKPDMDGYDKTGNYQTKWEIEEEGLVYTCYKYRQPIRYAVVEQRIKLFHQQKRIDFETALLNWEGVLYREFRMALPLNMTDGQVAYEVPFGVVEVGKSEIEGAAGERYQTPCKDVHPRGIENWISSSNSKYGVTMSSSVVVHDWIDPTDNPAENQILQPILLASRKSCHWEGNDYLQTGNHTFRFSITSHPAGWQNGSVFGRQVNEKLLTIQVSHPFANAILPETMSFLKTNQESVLISTIKKAEDSDEVVIRMAEMNGKDQNIEIEMYQNISQAKQTNLIETDLKPLKAEGNRLKFSLGHHAIETIKLK